MSRHHLHKLSSLSSGRVLTANVDSLSLERVRPRRASFRCLNLKKVRQPKLCCKPSYEYFLYSGDPSHPLRFHSQTCSKTMQCLNGSPYLQLSHSQKGKGEKETWKGRREALCWGTNERGTLCWGTNERGNSAKGQK